ncbi:SacI homology domain-containing protein [Amylocarpus encephaloides]|uniref:SacI homology domain-containing protein n=1 Tax=Amylocarpus encephaloides TaxID=45428 RepID=A0A9P7YJC1_9HELO|nr:SacI homology domain-containing protein [Amylocarpus encephaloides]
MPGLARKLLVFAAVDGLVLQPLAQKGQRPAPAVKIAYNDNNIGPAVKDGVEAQTQGDDRCFEAFGVVGLLNVSKSSFLISITRRQQVAQIQGRPVYVITEVSYTPLASWKEASASIEHTRKSLQTGTVDSHELDDRDTDDEGIAFGSGSDDVDDDGEPPAVINPTIPGHKRTSSVAEDVISKKGTYGLFAKEWFSNRGWTANQRRNLGMTSSESEINKTQGSEAGGSPAVVEDREEAEKAKVLTDKGKESSDVAGALLPKLLRSTRLYFGTSRSFYFSYDYDLTRSFLNHDTSNSDLPLYKRADPLFFWNRHITQPFIDAGQTTLVLPLLQGFVGQRTFEMDTDPPSIVGLEGVEKSSVEMVDLSPRMSEDTPIPKSDGTSGIFRGRSKSPRRRDTMKSFSLTLISRRSVKRAGLRYLRRGVDDYGHTANSVETEQVLSDVDWKPSSKIHSFVQIRGSIPVFFSQSPYSFKPIPQIQHSTETNYEAFSKHFENLSERYGRVQVASLVEKHGPEAIVGEQFEKFATRINEVGGVRGSTIGFEWFDFHSACRGMKFENVSLLMDNLGAVLDNYGYTVWVDGVQQTKQSGVLRANCMDCLDRTNVVQNYIGKRALEQQLNDEGIDLSLQLDQTTQWFNMLWADNGDAVSKQYASTAAMKGDFTRTRKRDYKGAITDMGLSISRFYSGIVNDFFSQAAIDFLLGNVTAVVFEDFETSLMSRDPAVSMQKMRQQAIEACQRLVVADEQEELIGGWTLLTPQVPNTIKSTPFEEAILLLTDSGLYCCRFDWNMEKVSSFERVSLEHILGIKYGTYITSTLSASQSDEERNVGFVITYRAGKNDISRVNTRSMSIVARLDVDLFAAETAGGAPGAPGAATSSVPSGLAALLGRPQTPADRVLALKALPAPSTATEANESRINEREQVKGICSEIERMILLGQVTEVGSERKPLLEAGDVISLNEARKSTGLLEQLGHSFKKLIWA